MNSTETPTQLGSFLSSAMHERGLSIKDVAITLGITYEHIRRIVRGESVPSKLTLKAMCELVGADLSEAAKLATADRIRKKYGTVPIEIAGKKPSLEPMERVWDFLTKNQQQDLITMAQALAQRNRAST